MNNDLISREALRNEIDSWGLNDYDKYDFLEAIDNAPTVEGCFTKCVDCERVVKIKEERPHGEWKETGDMQEYWAEEYQCSICGAKDHWHNFCPNCGADMREAE